MTHILKTTIFTIFVPGTVVIAIPYCLLRNVELFSFEIGKIKYFGLVPIFVGVFIYLWCASNFAIIGKGTPAPIDPPKNLVVKGPHKIVRNPMYLAVITTLIGESVLFESYMILFYVLIFFAIFHLFIVFYEEPTLKKQFKDEYKNYLRTVPRWVPKCHF